MTRIAPLVFALLLAGCAASPPPLSGHAPAGWVKDPCDLRVTGFSGGAQPGAVFARKDPSGAPLFAAHIVEAVGDKLEAGITPAAVDGHHDAQAWKTREGFVEVYWTRDAGAWSGDYTVSRPSSSDPDPVLSRNATAHAVLGSVGVPYTEVAWVTGPDSWAGPESIAAWRDVGGARMTLVSISDSRMEAEQTQLLRRTVHVDPDFTVRSDLLGVAEAGRIAQGFLDCHGKDGTQFRVNTTLTQALVYEGNLAYWFYPEPAAGWAGSCGLQDAGRLHVGLDAVTGTVLSSDLHC